MRGFPSTKAWIGLAVAALGLPLACATAVENPIAQGGGGPGGDGPGGGGSTTSVGGAGGGSGPCVFAEDCAAFTDNCNTGTCINGICQKLPANEGTACDDGKACSINDSCQAGVCTGTTEKACPSSNPCMVGKCDLATDTCTEVPGNNGSACVDDDPCTLTASCQNGACAPGQPVDCSFLDSVCGVGTCDPQLGCVAMPQNDGTPCNDMLFCTIGDTCQGGTCVGAPNTCAAPGDVCMIGSCNENTDTCVAVPGNDGGACDDGNSCTSGETCASGSCVGGVPANQGAACDDENGCTSGTTCSNGLCSNATSTISQCIDNDLCCPPGCVADNDCLYWQSGVQQNVPAASLVGWTQCYEDTYADSNTPMQTILQQCDKSKLLMACRQAGSPSFTLLAMAPRVDVLFDCGQQTNCTKQSNGVGWYYSDDYSWGFAPGGLSVNRNSCDYNDGSQQSPELRLCWHSGFGQINGGYRCGDNSLFDFSWERVVFEAD